MEIVARFDRDLCCISINSNIEKITGLKPEMVVGKDYRKLGLPLKVSRALGKGFKEVIATGNSKILQFKAHANAGGLQFQQITIPEFDQQENLKSFLCVIQQSTEQQSKPTLKHTKKEFEIQVETHIAEIKEREQQITRIFETTAEGIILVNIGGDIVKANAAAIRILKLDPEKIHEQTLHLPYWEIPARWTVLNPDKTPMQLSQNPLARAIVDKQVTNNVEFGIKFDNGDIIWVNTSTAPFIDDTGRVQGIVFTFTDVTEQKKLRDEKELFTQKLIEVQEEERSRISRELHDDTAQWLALLTLEIDNIISKFDDVSHDIIVRLQKLRDTTEKALQEVRRFSHELRPTVLEHFGISAALELIVNEFESVNSGIKIGASLKISGIKRSLSKQTELVIFRIAQESLNNVRKHAQATEVNVHLEFSPSSVNLTIADNGQGFKLEKKQNIPGPERGGLGLMGMRERAHLIGGKLRVDSSPGKGTVISLEVPAKVQS